MKALAIFISLFFYLNLLNAFMQSYPFGSSTETIKAIKEGSIDDFKKAFNKLVEPGKDINQAEKGFNYTSLYIAALKGKADVVDFLLEKGADPNARIYSGETALMASVRYPEIAKKLIEAGADPNVKAKGYFTALQSAVSLAEPKSIDMLIEKGADLHVVNERKQNLLHILAKSVTPAINKEQRPQLAKLLLDKGLDPNFVDEKGRTALHYSSQKDRPELTEVFLQNNADVNLKDHKGKTALHYASQTDSFKTLDLLIKNKADIQAVDLQGWQPLHYASANVNFKSGEILLEKGAELNEQDKEGNTALHLLALGQPKYLLSDAQKAFRRSQEKVFGEFTAQFAKRKDSVFGLSYGSIPLNSIRNDFFKTQGSSISFYQATQKNRMDFMSLLIEEGINVDEQNNRGNTALHMVSRSKLKEKKEVARLLIQQKANLNIINHEGEMALSNRRILGEFVYATFSSRPNARALYEKSKGFLGRRFKVRR